MMKQLLLISAFIGAAISVNAQTYAVADGETITSTTTITSVPDVTLSFGEDTYTVKADATINEGAVYHHYVSGGINPVDGNGLAFDKAGATTPVKGSLFAMKVEKDGNMEIAVVLNASKKYYILEDGVALEDFNGFTVADKYYGTYSFPVKAGKTYTTFCTGSKLGFYGFTYTPTGTGIQDSTIEKEVISTEYFNVVGVRTNQAEKGLNMVKRTMSDGTVKVEKLYVR